jgi:hypothetical protein
MQISDWLRQHLNAEQTTPICLDSRWNRWHAKPVLLYSVVSHDTRSHRILVGEKWLRDRFPLTAVTNRLLGVNDVLEWEIHPHDQFVLTDYPNLPLSRCRELPGALA